METKTTILAFGAGKSKNIFKDKKYESKAQKHKS